MYICKDNKYPFNNFFSLEECKVNVNLLESIVEYIRNIEHALKEIIQQNIDLKNQVKSKALTDASEYDNESILKKYSFGDNYIEQLGKIINKFKISFNEENKLLLNESFKGNAQDGYIKNEKSKENHIFELPDEIKDIKNYYEGKIDLMQKKIKVSEILESLYLKQIDEFRKINK